MTENDTPVCTRCGICCHYYNVQGKLVRCKHVVRLRSGKTLCRIYNQRLGQVIGKTMQKGKIIDVVCHNRSTVKFNYLGCPFNKEGQKLAFSGDYTIPMVQSKLGMFDK